MARAEYDPGAEYIEHNCEHFERNDGGSHKTFFIGYRETVSVCRRCWKVITAMVLEEFFVGRYMGHTLPSWGPGSEHYGES